MPLKRTRSSSAPPAQPSPMSRAPLTSTPYPRPGSPSRGTLSLASSGSSSPGERPKPEGTWSARTGEQAAHQPAGNTISETKHDTDTDTNNNDNHNTNTNTGGNPVLVGYASSS